MSDDAPKVPAPIAIANLTATSATSDEQLVASWIANLRSEHSRTNFQTTARRFLAALAAPLRRATIEDVRQALEAITAGLAPSSARQIVLRVKSLLSYGHRVGYLQFNAGAVIKAHAEARSVAQRIISEVEIGLLLCSAPAEARGGQRWHQSEALGPLAAPRPRQPRHRPWRRLAGGAIDARSRQHRGH